MKTYKLILLLFITIVLDLSWAASSYNINLVAHVSSITQYNSNANFGVSDVWGYTDEDDNEYAIVGYRYGTFIYDVSSNPAEPILIVDIIGPSNNDYYFHRDFKVYGDYLYIVNEMAGLDEGVQIIDLSPLPNNTPIKLNTYTEVLQSHNLWIDSERALAFIEKQYPENIHVLDLSFPEFPTNAFAFNYDMGENCHDIYTFDNMAFISEGFSCQFGIYDISNSLNPIKINSIPSFGYAHNAWLSNDKTHLITSEETVGMTVKLWDIQDLQNINLSGEYLGENLLAHNVHVLNDFLYISHYTTGLKIVDIFDPEKPVEVAAYDTYPADDNDGFFGCWGAYPYTKNNYIYASDMQTGLFVLEFNNVSAGWIMGTISNGATPFSNITIQSSLNEKTFFANSLGEFSFGFPSGEQEFKFIVNDNIISTQTIYIYPHITTQINIFIYELGDLNEDVELNILDIIIMVNLILSNEFIAMGDLNEDGELNILDVIILVNIILSNNIIH